MILNMLDERVKFFSYLGPLLLTWIINYIHYNVWDEISYPFLNFNGAAVEV